MKVSMRVTLDGLLRALRWRAHNIAEELSTSRRARMRGDRGQTQRRTGRPTRDHGNDRRR